MIIPVRYTSLLVIFCSVLFIAACSSSKKTSRNNIQLDPIVVRSNDYNYRASSPITWDIKHTRLRLSFNWQERSANGEAWLEIEPYMGNIVPDSIVLDAQTMQIAKVTLTNLSVQREYAADYTYKDNKLVIQTDGEKGELLIYIKYKALPYMESTGGSAAITDDRGLYFVNHDGKIPGKPMQIWTQGETQANSHWMPTIDRPNERFTTQLELIVEDTMTTLSNGKLAEQKELLDNKRMDIWVMDKPIQPYVVTFVVGDYTRIIGSWEDKEVSYYVEHAYKIYGREMFKHTPEMMGFFSKVTGVRYPWNKYSQVVVRDFVSGAMENTTASTFGEFVNQNFREIKDHNYEDVVAHELFHQWFGDYVTAESWSNITLNESFANYGEQLWSRFKHGVASEQELAYDDLNTYLNNNGSIDKTLVRYYYKSREDLFDRVSYQKGGAILRYLHGLMGDMAFSKAMQLYLTQNALKPAEVHHWRLAVEEATGKDWNWFFDQWYMKPGHPTLEIEHDYNDEQKQLVVTVKQIQNKKYGVYDLPLKTLVVNGDDKQVVDWHLKEKEEVFTYEYNNGKRPVVVPDVEHWLVGRIYEHKPSAIWKEQFEQVEEGDVISKLRALYGNSLEKGKSPKEDYDEKTAIFELALKDNNEFVRRKTMTILSTAKSQKKIDYWNETVKAVAQNDKEASVRALALSALANWKVNEPALFYDALESQSYTEAGAALNAISVFDEDTAYTISKKLLNDDPKGLLQENVWVSIANKGDAADYRHFDEHRYHFNGSNKIFFADVIGAYVISVDDLSVAERSLKIAKEAASTENIKSYRSAMVVGLLELAYQLEEEANAAKTYYLKELATNKRALVRSVVDDLIADEKEKENIDTYKMYYKKVFRD